MYAATPGTGTTRDLLWSRLGDEILARRAAAGSDGAFTALYERYHGPLLSYCRSILLNVEDAHDATQSALENALRALPSRDAGRPLRPWLYRIAHNEAVTLLRRRQSHDELVPDTEAATSAPSPEIYAEQRSRIEQLVEDLRMLPERQRGALVMRELSGLSYEEVGVALGLTAANARRAVFDARSALLDVAGGRDAECVTIRHALSDGDRRSVRARRIRAHLRSCDGCASFQAAIGARRADLPAIAPWLSGAAAASALGIGAGGTAGGGALVAAGGAGGGLGFSLLPGAVKSLAVVAVVATTGTAAMQIERAATPDPRPHARSQAAMPQRHARAPGTLTAASVSAAAAARSAGNSATTSSRARGAASGASITTHHSKSELKSSSLKKSKAPKAHATPANVAYDPSPPPPPPPAAAPAKPAPKPSQTLADKLKAIQAQIMAAFTNAQNTAAAGTQSALQKASSIVSGTLSSVQALVHNVLSSFGIAVPSSVASASKPPTNPSSLSGVLAPVQQVLGGVNALLAQLFGKK